MAAWGHHVQRRGGIYHLRLRVPDDIRDRVGVREIRRSLETRCPLEARARVADLYARVSAALSEIRSSRDGDAALMLAEILGQGHAASVRVTRSARSPAPLVPTVTEFLEDSYLAEKRLGEDSRRHIINYVTWFARITGDRRLSDYARGHVVEYVRKLERLKWTLGKDPKDLERPLADLLRESEGGRCLGTTTVEKHLTHVRAFMLTALGYHKFAAEADVRTAFAPVPLSAFVPPVSKRGIWTVDALNRLFASPTWEPGARRDAHWWLPILALYTGARLEELAQLHHEDLRRDRHGLPFLDINDEGVRRLKNSGSVRLIPVHSALVGLGVEDLFKSRKSAVCDGQPGLVFPELKPHGRMRKLGGGYTVWFTRYRRAHEIYEPGVDFHSFRHTFVSRLGELDVPGLKIARLAGHAEADPDERRMRMTKRYSHYDIGPLREAIERLEYPGLKLDRLIVT